MTILLNENSAYRNILVATDFSPSSRSALNQAVLLAGKNGAKLTLAHTLPDLRTLVESASYQAKVDFLYGEGSDFYREVQQESDRKMRQMLTEVSAGNQDVGILTLLGSPFVEITHAVQQKEFDLVLIGTRGLSAWNNFLVGSTAIRLIRKCPSSVWIVKGEHQTLPKSILAATDFSDASRKAVLEALLIAQEASAEFHLLHVVDSNDASDEILARIPDGSSIRHAVNDEAKDRFNGFVDSLNVKHDQFHLHLTTGTPWQEIGRLAKHLNVDLIAMSTVGRSGIQGVLLGNTAEKVLGSCNCSILTVKPVGFVSPITPPFWSLTPDQSKVSAQAKMSDTHDQS